MAGAYHSSNWTGEEPAHARENRSRSQAKPVIIHDGRVASALASLCRRIVVVVSRCTYISFRFRGSTCYRRLLASAPLLGLIPRGIL